MLGCTGVNNQSELLCSISTCFTSPGGPTVRRYCLTLDKSRDMFVVSATSNLPELIYLIDSWSLCSVGMFQTMGSFLDMERRPSTMCLVGSNCMEERNL
jgi:hypothetical protein